MNIQSWSPDNCKCVVYTENGTKYYDVTKNPDKVKFTAPVKETHCNGHTKTGQAWFDEIRKTNNDLMYSYFPKGTEIDSDNPTHQTKLKQFEKEKARMKAVS